MQENESNTNTESAASGKTSVKQRYQRAVLIRYGKMGFIGQFRHSEREIPTQATHAVVQTERGLEIGEIVAPYCHHKGRYLLGNEKIEKYCQASGGSEYPFSKKGKVVRFANDQDLNEQRHLNLSAIKERKYCQQLIDKYKLPMHLVDTEHLFGGDRIIYYFMADGRVDFRQLVKELAQEYQTRIEMRQIGARDEARLIADFETCGRQCCCKNFLKVLQPVNMRMAKLQKATLDPAKISGRCGRLKCCLRYEDRVYTELKKNLPRKGSSVLTDRGHGMVIETQVITQLVKIRLEAGPIIAVNIDEIKDSNYKPTAKKTLPENNKKNKDGEGPAPKEKKNNSDSIESEGQNKPRKKRRRRRKKNVNSGSHSRGESDRPGDKNDPTPAPSGQ